MMEKRTMIKCKSFVLILFLMFCSCIDGKLDTYTFTSFTAPVDAAYFKGKWACWSNLKNLSPMPVISEIEFDIEKIEFIYSLFDSVMELKARYSGNWAVVSDTVLLFNMKNSSTDTTGDSTAMKTFQKDTIMMHIDYWNSQEWFTDCSTFKKILSKFDYPECIYEFSLKFEKR